MTLKMNVRPTHHGEERQTRSRRKKADGVGHQVQTASQKVMKQPTPKARQKKPKRPKEKFVSTRKYFGEKEDVYIMDAKTRCVV